MSKRIIPSYQEVRAFNMDSITPSKMEISDFHDVKKMASHIKWMHNEVKLANDGKFMIATQAVTNPEFISTKNIAFIILGLYLTKASHDESFIRTLYGNIPTVIIDDEEVSINSPLILEHYGTTMSEAFIDLFNAELHDEPAHIDILIVRFCCALFGLN